jgi:hypothetical protein
MRAMALRAALLAALALAAAPAAADDAAPRVELPIHAVTLSNGAVRYGVPIRIGATTLDAALDTGSTGLRVLPGVLRAGDATASEEPEVYGYASGSRYEGLAGEATLGLGAIAARAPIHLISAIGCFAHLPRCPASRTPLPHYGIASDGLPDEGFKAILGTDMDRARIANPLAAMGVRRWIVELPRPGRPDEGRLILNPTPAETAGYAMLPVVGPYSQIQGGGLHDALPGCLIHGQTRARVCGPVLLDTGSSFLAVANARIAQPWPDGDAVSLEVYGADGTVAARTAFTLGDRDAATRLVWRSELAAPRPSIFAGAAPYYAWSVLYDARRQQIGLKARAAAEP